MTLHSALARLKVGCPAKPTSSACRFSQQQQIPLPSVPIIGPVLWSVAAVGTTWFTCAAYEVHRDLNKVTRMESFRESHRPHISERELEMARLTIAIQERYPPSPKNHRGLDGSNPVVAWWERQGECGRVVASIIGINLCTLVPSTILPPAKDFLLRNFAHFPAMPDFRSHQLLTSAFLHTGPLHLGVNMVAFYTFSLNGVGGKGAVHTPALQSSGSALLAFCLSAAVTSSLGYHISTLFRTEKLARFGFGLGFSGVASALIATACVAQPHVKIPLIIPMKARDFLSCLEGIEVLGALGLVGRLIPSMSNASHAAHLSGLLFGEAYARWSGRGELWLFFRSQAFRLMKRLGAI